MNLSPRRAELLALVALLLQLLFFLFTLLVGSYANSWAVEIEAWHFLGGAVIWLILLLQFHQRRLAQEERLDAEQYHRLQREGKDTSVFEGTMVEENLHLAARRLKWMEKYLLPIFAVLIAGYMLGIGFWLYYGINPDEAHFLAEHGVRLESAAFMAIFALISFLFSCYAVGMSKQSEWRALRAGGSYLLSNALSSFAVAIVILAVDFDYTGADLIAAYVLLGVMGAIGLETIFNLVLDAFRPRIKGQYRRAAFESRLLGLFSEPGGILRTAAHALDYQFGFKVSETWFFQLLSKAVVPLIMLQMLALYLLTGIAIVAPGNVGVLERCGAPLNVHDPYGSGLHLKLPWPIDKMRSFPVEQLQVIEVGFERNEPRYDKEGKEIPDLTPIIWTKEHWKEEYPFMVAMEGARKESRVEASGVEGEKGEKGLSSDFDLLVVALVIHYRISNVADYAYGDDTHCYRDSHELLKAICYRETLQYAANSDVDKLLGPGREETTRLLREAIRAQVKEYQMGVEVVFVGLESVHPPVKVADAYEKVISALQQKQAAILEAQGQATATLSRAQGEKAVRVLSARAYAFERSVVSRADGERFAQQMEAFEKGGEVYLWREYLSVLEELLPGMRKYIMATDKVNSWVYELDLKEKLEPDLFKDFGIEKDKQESTQ